MKLTDKADTCECRTTPWVTIEMLGGLHHTDDSGIRYVRCPDRDHCLRGAPVRDGRLADHWRNIDRPSCRWIGHEVRESMPCQCGGWPWIRSSTLSLVTHVGLIPSNPVASLSCPGCRKWVDADRNRIAFHTRHDDTACVWSGIYVAVGSDVPSLGLKAPASLAP